MTQYPDKVWCLMHKGVFQTTAPIKDQLVWEWQEFVLPAADLSSPLGAVAMRDAVYKAARRAYSKTENFPAIFDAIEKTPLPTHAALLAHAMRVPEVAAMVDAGKPLLDMALWTESAADGEIVIMTVGTIRKLRAALAQFTGAKP